MSQDAYGKQELINIINHLQAKLNFYKQQFEENQHKQIMHEELHARIKVEASMNKKLQEINIDLKKENEQLNEEIKRLQDLTSSREKDGYDSVFIKTQQVNQMKQRTKHFKADAPNLDPWFLRNLKEKDRLATYPKKFN